MLNPTWPAPTMMIFTEISFGKVNAHTQSFFKGGGGKSQPA